MAYLLTLATTAPGIDLPPAVMIVTGLSLLGVVVLGLRNRNRDHG
jgi:hypothetical protein